jgi:hypothetical protein
MKKLLLLTVLALTTIGAMAQDKANHNTSRSNKRAGGKVDPNTNASLSKADAERAITVNDSLSVNRKCCISSILPPPCGAEEKPISYTRLSKADAKIAIPAFKKYIRLKGDGVVTLRSEARILERTACVKAGSTFYEFTDGTTICLTASVSAKSQNLPSEKTVNDNNANSVNRACRGILVTNSTGTAIYKKVTEVNGKSKK